MTRTSLSRALVGLAVITVALLIFSAGVASGRRREPVFHCVKGSPYPGMELTCHLEGRR
jgi:hypothetical protein